MMARKGSMLLVSALGALTALQAAAATRTDPKALNESNSGYVIGWVVGGQRVLFLNTQTEEEFNSGLDAYCKRLPVGHYAVSRIGTPWGNVKSESPFSFDVVAGQKSYIGTLAGDWVPKRRYAAERAANPPTRKYNLGLWGISYDFFLFNQFEEISKKYIKKCPDVPASEVTVLLME
jgi:hypothetical protein